MDETSPNIDALFDRGLRALHGNDPAEAERTFKRVLQLIPDDSEGLTLLGVALQQLGRGEEATQFLKRAVLLDGTAADAHYNLAEVLAVLNELGEAEVHYQRCVELEPANAVAWRRLGEVRERRSDQAGAAHAVERALQAEGHLFLPGWSERLVAEVPRPRNNLPGLKLSAAASPENLEAQIALYRTAAACENVETFEAAIDAALRLAPGNRRIMGDRVNYLLRLKQDDQAATAAETFNERFPNDPEVLILNICVCYRRNKLDDALKLLNQLVEIKPNDPSAYLNLGHVLAQLGRNREAEAPLRHALDLDPKFVAAQISLSICLEHINRRHDAIVEARDATQKQPTDVGAIDWLATLLTRDGKHSEAAVLRRRTLELAPNSLAALSSAGALRFDQGLAEEGWPLLEQGMAVAPDDPLAYGAALLFSNAHPHLGVAEIYELHRKWSQVLHRKLGPSYKFWTNDRNPDRRLKVGYLTADARAHSVSYFLEPLLTAHDRSNIEPVILDNVVAPDPVTDQFKKIVPNWHRIVGMEDRPVAELIRNLEIDILVDLVGHTSNSRLNVFSMHPSPVQVAFLGYPNSTGLPELDYRLTDDICDPPGRADLYHSEKLVRLPGSFLCFLPRTPYPDVGPLPAIQNGHITFASFNAAHKINQNVIRTWASVLKRVRGSQLIFKAAGMSDPQTQANMIAGFSRNGVGKERLTFVERTRLYYEHLEIYNRCDIALDTFPYNGTTTTCESLLMGLPVVALVGDRHASRVTLSILSQLNLSKFAGDSEEQYIAIAVALAADRAALEASRRSLRPQMLESRLMNAAAHALAVENAYRQMWQTWCQ